MSLPSVPLRRGEVEIGGESVEFRSLSRTQAAHLAGMVSTHPAEALEVYAVACALELPEADAEKWLDESDPIEAGRLIDAIMELSGARGDRDDPQGLTRLPSPRAVSKRSTGT